MRVSHGSTEGGVHPDRSRIAHWRTGAFLALALSLTGPTACKSDPPAPRAISPKSLISTAAPLVLSRPLKVHPSNPRYFTDASGRAVYLTGSHTWTNFQDGGPEDPPPAFDYTTYLDFLQQHGHNFFRLWSWEQAKGANMNPSGFWFSPTPYARPGPGTALDGKPKFDLNSFNQAYFDRLRQRVVMAGRRNMYVSVMLFNGWSNAARKGKYAYNNPWQGHPYNRKNNINNIDGDPDNDGSGLEIHTLQVRQVTALQERYVRKIIDTVNNLDNVLYEISNESDGGPTYTAWQYHMINFIKSYEATQLKQHPVGMTAEWPNGNNGDLFNSPADWIAPNNDDGNYLADPRPADGRKVIVSDTDHLCGICGNRAWVWKSFTRGLNPLLMDGHVSQYIDTDYDPSNPVWADIRGNLGYARSYAVRMNLAAMTPRGDLASSGYCLADPGREYLVYLPTRVHPEDSTLERVVKGWFEGTVTVDLSRVSGAVDIEWFNPTEGKVVAAGKASGGGKQKFTAPFGGDAVLYLHASEGRPQK